MSVAPCRERHSTSGAKSDAGDAHVLAEIVRLDRSHHRPVAEDSQLSEAIKLVAPLALRAPGGRAQAWTTKATRGTVGWRSRSGIGGCSLQVVRQMVRSNYGLVP